MTVARPPAILDHLSALADTTRSRILLILDRHELSVSELCSVMQLPQSTVSRHLKALADSGWISARAEGTSNVYAMTRRRSRVIGTPAVGARARPGRANACGGPRSAAGADGACRAPHQIAGIFLVGGRTVGPDARRSVRRARAPGSAGGIRRRRLDGRRPRLRHWTDDGFPRPVRGPGHRGGCVGCDAAGSEEAPAGFRERRAPTRRPRGAARSTTAGSMPRRLLLVLHHLPEPDRALADVARVLKPHGRLLIIDMLPHDRESYRQQMGHVWLGFSEEHIRRILGETGFGDVRIVPLAPDPKSKGPGLFVATAKKRTEQIVDLTKAES